MQKRRRHFFVLGTLLATAGLFSWAAASPQGINTASAGTYSPVGPHPITGTPISSLPFTITQCGNYFLTGCLTGASGQNGIRIDADDVTLDLNGFTLQGVTGSLDGVTIISGSFQNVVIQNGVVRDWGGDGIEVSGSNNVLIDNIAVYSNDNDGIKFTGGAVQNCRVRQNGRAGIVGQLVGGADQRIEDCIVTQNGQTFTASGIDLEPSDSSALVLNNVVVGNSGNGITTGDSALIEGCVVFDNGGTGIDTSNSLVRGNSVTGQTTNINATGASTEVDNHEGP